MYPNELKGRWKKKYLYIKELISISLSEGIEE
jgi:hypothetical protein